MGGATFALWDTETAAAVLGAEGEFDFIDIQVADGEDVDTVQQRIADVLPANTEVVDRQTLIDEANDDVGEFIGVFGTGLLIFAFITAFVSAFLINNVFQITIGQRLRELALLRAVGGAGRQVRRLIVVEAFVMSVIATVIGIFAGVGVGKLILGIFNAAGAGFPDFGTRLSPTRDRHGLRRRRRDHAAGGDRPGAAGLQDPARRGDASRARLRGARHEAAGDRHGHRDRRLGHVPGRAAGPAGRHARSDRPGRRRRPDAVPRDRQRVVDGGQAGDEADRLAGGQAVQGTGSTCVGERRTGAATHVGNGRRADDRRRPRGRVVGVRGVACATRSSRRWTVGVTADWVVTSDSFLLPDVVATTLQDVPEVGAVTGVTSINLRIDDDSKTFGVADPAALEQLINVGLERRELAGTPRRRHLRPREPGRGTTTSRSARRST